MLRMSSKNDKTAFQIGAEAVSKIAHPRVHSQTVQANLDESTTFLAEFKAKVSRAAMLANDESNRRLDPLLEDIRFSDPVSTAGAFADESALLAIADEFIGAIEDGRDIPEESITRSRRLLAVRNDLCRQSK